MKKIIALTISVLLSLSALAQHDAAEALKKSFETENKDTVAWYHNFIYNFGVNEGLIHNWPAGGEFGSLVINTLFSGNATYFHHNNIWSNNLDLAYGLNYVGSQGFIPHKTDDRIDYTSRYSTQIKGSKDFYLTGLFNFKSQFTKGYDYSQPQWDTTSTSKFFSPAYFTLAIGFEYRKGTNLSLFLSPLAAKLTVVDKYYTTAKPEGAFGVEYGKTSRLETGAYFSGRYYVNINKRATFKTMLDLYMNYLAKDIKDSTGIIVRKDNPGNVDIYWDNLFTYQISGLFNMTLGLTLLYDNDIPFKRSDISNNDDPVKGLGWWQMKQIFTFGLQVKF